MRTTQKVFLCRSNIENIESCLAKHNYFMQIFVILATLFYCKFVGGNYIILFILLLFFNTNIKEKCLEQTT